MQEAQVVRDFLFPAGQQAPGAVEPGVGAFDFPAARRAAAAFRLRGLICLARHMRRITSRASRATDGFASVPLVETEMLRLLGSGLGTFNRDGIQGLGNQFLVRHIGAIDGDGQRHATAIGRGKGVRNRCFARRQKVSGTFFNRQTQPSASWLTESTSRFADRNKRFLTPFVEPFVEPAQRSAFRASGAVFPLSWYT